MDKIKKEPFFTEINPELNKRLFAFMDKTGIKKFKVLEIAITDYLQKNDR